MQEAGVLLLVEEGVRIWSAGPDAGPVRARDAYRGHAYTESRREAEASGHRWLVISARHGFLEPDAVIDAYDESFSVPESGPITIERLREQAVELGLSRYGAVFALGGWGHIGRVKNAFRGLPAVTGWSIEAQRRAAEPQDHLIDASLL